MKPLKLDLVGFALIGAVAVGASLMMQPHATDVSDMSARGMLAVQERMPRPAAR